MIRVGIGGWNFEPWKNNFYPKGLAATKELAYASERLHAIYEEVGGFGTLLVFCFDYADNPTAWRHSMELFAGEVMPRFKTLVPK